MQAVQPLTVISRHALTGVFVNCQKHFEKTILTVIPPIRKSSRNLNVCNLLRLGTLYYASSDSKRSLNRICHRHLRTSWYRVHTSRCPNVHSPFRSSKSNCNSTVVSSRTWDRLVDIAYPVCMSRGDIPPVEARTG